MKKRKVWLIRESDGTYAICKYKPKLFNGNVIYRMEYPFAYVKHLCPNMTKQFFGLKKHLDINTCVKVYFDIEIITRDKK